jgi:hypothetical protein
MRTLTLLGAAAIVLGATGVAAAQPVPPPGTPEVEATNEGAPTQDAHGHPGMHGGPHWMRHGMMRPSRGAHFHFARNNGVVDIRCAEDEPMRACVDAASVLLDKLAGQQPK